ncbi:hypothetical protein BH20ACT2_BH20ACT2_17740 [soil metagenome]
MSDAIGGVVVTILPVVAVLFVGGLLGVPLFLLWRHRTWVRVMPAEGWLSFAVVVASMAYVASQVHPDLVFASTTPAGGDMGAHVWAPAYLRDHLLPHGRLTGWSPDWYAGFPAFQFYMVVPSLAIVLLAELIPYGIAFKLVAVSGLVALPLAAWAFGKLAGLRFPAPPLLAVAAMAFVFNREPVLNGTGNIIGGNMASTMAGEFAFSISLALAVLYLGVLVRGLRTGRHRALAAVLLALTGLCHLIPAFFALAATLVAFGLRFGADAVHHLRARSAERAQELEQVREHFADPLPLSSPTPAFEGWRRLRWLATVGPVAGALSAFWVLPFFWRRAYLNDMGWEKLPTPGSDASLATYLFPGGLRLVIALAAVGMVVSLLFRVRAGVLLSVTALGFAAAFVLLPQGRLWNARVLPFYYLCAYLLAGVGVAEVGRAVATLLAPDPRRPLRLVKAMTAPVGAIVALVVVAFPMGALPLSTRGTDGVARWMGLSTSHRNDVSGWAEWNFTGYERKDAYPEYRAIVTTMEEVGEERGCGRALWEYDNEPLNAYGTPMALMLLPHWTDGCIGSMEGLYFEASATTPYHFLMQTELSTRPSSAQRDLPYAGFDIDLGVQHLQLMGVRYYLALTPEAKAAAQEHDELTEVASSGPWEVYEVDESPVVAPLDHLPAVLTDVADAGSEWLDPSVDWFIDPSRWDVPLASSGPEGWPRVAEGESPPRQEVEPVTVSDIRTDDNSISFTVDEPGTPVLVKASYFPNWQADGADGPYRVTPNLMVVVPTDDEVVLRYGWTPVDAFSWGLTFAGLAGVVVLWRKRAVAGDEPEPSPTEQDRPGASGASGARRGDVTAAP